MVTKSQYGLRYSTHTAATGSRFYIFGPKGLVTTPGEGSLLFIPYLGPKALNATHVLIPHLRPYLALTTKLPLRASRFD